MDDRNILPGELLKLRNNLVKKLTATQKKSIYECKSGDEIIRRMDDLFNLQAAIKRLDVLIRLAIKCPIGWEGISLCVTYEDEEKFNPGIKKIGDYKNGK